MKSGVKSSEEAAFLVATSLQFQKKIQNRSRFGELCCEALDSPGPSSEGQRAFRQRENNSDKHELYSSGQKNCPGIVLQGEQSKRGNRYFLDPVAHPQERKHSEQLIQKQMSYIHSQAAPGHDGDQLFSIHGSAGSAQEARADVRSAEDSTAARFMQPLDPEKLHSSKAAPSLAPKALNAGRDCKAEAQNLDRQSTLAGSECGGSLPPGLHHLTRHWIPEKQRGDAVLQILGAADVKQADHMIKNMGQRDLRHAFNKIYHCETQSFNNNWLRRKLLEAVGLRPTPGTRHSRLSSSASFRTRAYRSTHRPSGNGSNAAVADRPQACSAGTSQTVTRKAAVEAAEAHAVAALHSMMAGGMEANKGTTDKKYCWSEECAAAPPDGEQCRVPEMAGLEQHANAFAPCKLNQEQNGDASSGGKSLCDAYVSNGVMKQNASVNID